MTRALTARRLISVSALAWLSLSVAASATSPGTPEDEMLRRATRVFARAVATPAAAIPAAVLMRATAVAVIPAAVKDGTRYRGIGVLSVRGARPDLWGPPAIVTLEGSIPLNLEPDVLDFVVVARTSRGADYLVQPHSPIPAPRSMSMTAGSLGHTTPVQTDADLVAYVQFGDYFAGVTVENWTIREEPLLNEALYGRPYTTDDIVRRAGFFRLPSAAREWRDVIGDYFREMS